MNPHSTLTLRSGNRMPILGLGTWELTDDTPGAIAHAVKLGYTLIDTACDYGSQAGIGQAIHRNHIPRESLYLVAKVEETDQVLKATKHYLNEIGVDYVDLLLLHRPPEVGVGEELWLELVEVRDRGLARDIGVSNYSTEQIRELVGRTGEWPAVNQIEWSPFGHSDAMQRFCEENGIVIQAYSPLTRGERLEDERLVSIAERYGRTPAQILLRWDLQRGIVPLPKANRFDHQEENVDVFDFALREADMKALDAMNERYSALGSLAYH